MQSRDLVSVALSLFAGSCLCFTSAFAKQTAETGKLKVQVKPKQAYVFIDGKAIREGSQTDKLVTGAHKVGVYNYGYLPKVQNVQIEAGKKVSQQVTLQSSGGKVSGPFAEIEFKGDPRAAVLLNGQTPDYFVGHVDEFNWEWIWHQRLLVKPGTYQVMVTREGNTIWSGSISPKAGQHLTVYLDQNGKTKTQAWKEGLTMGPQPRFHAGIASATIVPAPVSANLSAQSSELACGQSTALDWNSQNAVATSISGIGPVASHGDHSVSPERGTTYTLTAKGPGGVTTQTVTLNVNTRPTETLALSEPEIRYHKIGDKVVEQDSATLNWSANNANSASIQPFGTVSTSGSRTVSPSPDQTHTGPVNEDVTYTMTATNACGGATTKTATLHVVGSIDPPPPINLGSLFFPTAYPTQKHPDDGLVASEKEALTKLARHFNQHEQYEENAHLLIVGHADVRGSRSYNQALTERRADLIRSFLISQGVSADKIQTQALGKDDQISKSQVKDLQAQDPEKPDKWEARNKRATWLAYNRRADVILQPDGEHSTEAYPNDVSDARTLWQVPRPSLKAVEAASNAAGSQQARAARPGI